MYHQLWRRGGRDERDWLMSSPFEEGIDRYEFTAFLRIASRCPRVRMISFRAYIRLLGFELLVPPLLVDALFVVYCGIYFGVTC